MDDPRAYFIMADAHAREVETLSQGHLSMARRAWLQGDFATARMAYQKAAYISGRLEAEEARAALKRELTGFTRSDPLYTEILAAVKPVVERQPGVKQTDLYGLVDHDRELVSYVLYFAAENFDLYRKKAGRTYQIFPPGRVIDASPTREKAAAALSEPRAAFLEWLDATIARRKRGK